MRHDKLQSLSKTDAIELATRMRNKARNIRLQGKEMTTRLFRTGLGVLGGLTIGYWMGGLEHEKSKLSPTELESEGDPTKWGGMDKDLIVGLATSVVGIAAVNAKGKGARQAGSLLESFGGGMLAGWGYSRGRDAGFEAAEAA